MQAPKFLRDLLQSNNYWNKNSAEFTTANEYLGKLYPGQLQKDASGNYTEPEYDMTYEQFLDAQKKFDDDIQEAIQEVQDEDENEGAYIDDYSQFVEVAEQIDVLVLMPWGSIENKKLIVYTLNIPEEPESESDPETTKTIWVWHSEDDERICDDCAEYDGKIFEDKDDIPDVPLHPNCRCWVEEIELDDKGKPISSKVYKGQKPENKKNTTEENDDMLKNNNSNQIREGSIRKTITEEDGYVDDPKRIDQPTNDGITQPTLNIYNQKHPEAGFPKNVRELTRQQAEQIYTELYYNDRNIGNINNARIAHAIFDMGVMSNYSNVGKIVQNTLNETQGTKLAVDGIIGRQTIQALNNIPANQVNKFMETLIDNRIEYLRGLSDWNKYGRGWTARTNRY